jgi:hypothetical protein
MIFLHSSKNIKYKFLVRPPFSGSAQAKGGEDRQPGPVPQVRRLRSKDWRIGIAVEYPGRSIQETWISTRDRWTENQVQYQGRWTGNLSSVFKIGGQETWYDIHGRRTRNRNSGSVFKVGEKPVQFQSRWTRNLVHIQEQETWNSILSRWTRNPIKYSR